MADSPLSDDSLSSIGASTEPLPASDGPVISPPSGSHRQPRSPPLPSRKQLAGGNESDSTLTEQSSSEGRGGGRDGEDDEEEEDDDDGAGEPTPKASRPPKHSHDELRRPLDDGLSELSSAGEDSEEEEVDIKPKANALKLAVNNSPPRVPLMGELNARRATSRPASYTEVDNDEDDVLLAAKEDDEDLSEPEAEEKRAASSSKRGGKAARGARARGARAPARGRVTKKAAASRREESPILSDEEAEVKSPAASGPVVEVVVSPPRGKGRAGKGGRAPRGGKAAKGGAKNAAAAAKSRSRSVSRRIRP